MQLAYLVLHRTLHDYMHLPIPGLHMQNIHRVIAHPKIMKSSNALADVNVESSLSSLFVSLQYKIKWFDVWFDSQSTTGSCVKWIGWHWSVINHMTFRYFASRRQAHYPPMLWNVYWPSRFLTLEIYIIKSNWINLEVPVGMSHLTEISKLLTILVWHQNSKLLNTYGIILILVPLRQ